jgi:hypothetical protein
MITPLRMPSAARRRFASTVRERRATAPFATAPREPTSSERIGAAALRRLAAAA